MRPNREPRAGAVRNKEEARPEGDSPNSNPHVLIVDDLFINRKLLRVHLERLGCEVDMANDGSQAVAMSKQTAYDIIFMDVHMPYMNGMEATTLIQGQSGGQALIVGITADHCSSVNKQCKDAGMIDVLGKPVRKEQLESVIEMFKTTAPHQPQASPVGDSTGA